MTNEIELAGQEEELPIAITDGLLDEAAIKRAELMIDGINKIKNMSLKVTNYLDWSLQQGKPYLENSGAMKIANLWGVNFKERVFKPENGEKLSDAHGEYIMFTCHGRAEFKGRVLEDIGTCSTRDAFFGTQKDNGAMKFKPLEDVDLENIKKKAVTNLQGRLLKKILGLRYTIEDLKASGIDIGKMGIVDYASGGAGGGKISEAQSKRLYAILCARSDDKESRDTRTEMLKKFLKATYKIEHSKDIERTDYESIVEQAKAIADSTTTGA